MTYSLKFLFNGLSKFVSKDLIWYENFYGLRIRWVDAPGATSYEVRSDTSPAGSFDRVAGTGTRGTDGVVLPNRPDEPMLFYVIRAATACGIGP